MTLPQALFLLGLLSDTVAEMQQRIDALAAEVQRLNQPTTGSV